MTASSAASSTQAQNRCMGFLGENPKQTIVKKVGAIISNNARTALSISALNCWLHDRKAATDRMLQSVSQETVLGSSMIAPTTRIMQVVSQIDTLLENVRKDDLSWKGVACRKGPGALTCAFFMLPLGLAATEVAGYYAVYRIVDIAWNSFCAYGENPSSFNPVQDTRQFFINLVYHKKPAHTATGAGEKANKKEGTDKDKAKTDKKVEKKEKEKAAEPEADHPVIAFFKNLGSNPSKNADKGKAKAS